MGSTNSEIEQNVHDHTTLKDEENVTTDTTISPDRNPAKEPELTFDTGLRSWLQVLGSFFLFFNSWYVVPHRKQ